MSSPSGSLAGPLDPILNKDHNENYLLDHLQKLVPRSVIRRKRGFSVRHQKSERGVLPCPQSPRWNGLTSELNSGVPWTHRWLGRPGEEAGNFPHMIPPLPGASGIRGPHPNPPPPLPSSLTRAQPEVTDKHVQQGHRSASVG